ncbi:hypothetical protein POJ06DRAFT_71168 [Lipomyces tetrasporus]|uniref:Uncharacterized protein n=1 Tax=Lipomyces tetrasporus TaxID=54092 RepID=A0AAD7QUQ1_9ASCO|nr:uncharacterized protein POJ06DRAFT_71168 [Lipomyces tetrasporus]KAJ8101794.1 hypothetical protein POJ06DRAFT_71168 [Lipomyces tetrasporus]
MVTIPLVFAIASASGTRFGLVLMAFGFINFAGLSVELDVGLFMNGARVRCPRSKLFRFGCGLADLSCNVGVGFVARVSSSRELKDNADVKLRDCLTDSRAGVDDSDDQECEPDLAIPNVVCRESPATGIVPPFKTPPVLVPRCRTETAALELISKAIVCIASLPLINDAANCPSTASTLSRALHPPRAVSAARVVTDPPDTVRCLLRDSPPDSVRLRDR